LNEASEHKIAIVDTTTFCSGFPEGVGSEIWRDNVLHTFERIFEGETQLLLVEGPEGIEGIGKTILLAQFARREKDRCISIFVRAASWFAHDPALVIRDLCSQMHWILFKKELDSSTEIDDAYLAKLVYNLQRYSKQGQSNILVVVDGITGIPKDRMQVRDAILSKLPFGLPQFRFLFSGDSKELAKLPLPKLVQKTYTLSPFSFEETLRYFNGALPTETVSEVFKMCHGVPGYLAGIRRLLDSGTSAAALLENLPSSMPELFRMEWQPVAGANAQQVEIIAVLAHDRNKHTVAQLAKVFHTTPDLLQISLAPFTFIASPETKDSEIEFVSESYRQYAAKELASSKDRVNELIIDSLFGEPESERALMLLPFYLRDSGRDEALLSYLSPEHLAQMLDKSELLTPVKERARLGVETAARLRRDEELERLGLQSSVISDIDSFSVSKSETEARLRLDDVATCITLAQGAVLKEQRLRLFALIARDIREKNRALDQELLEQIDQLGREVDVSSMNPDRALELASDLLYARPELAIDILEKAAAGKRSPRGQRTIDWALASLSIQAFLSGQGDIKSAANAVSTRIKDPEVLRVSSAASVLFGGYAPSDVIAEVEKISNPEHKLALIRRWALRVHEPESVAMILDYALTLGITTTAYSPNATHLRELATPLPLVEEREVASRLVATFDAQRATVRQLGPTEDFIRLQLILAQTEAKYNKEGAGRRLEETYLYITYIEDLPIRAACISRLSAALPIIDPNKVFEQHSKIHSVCAADYVADIGRLLQMTADHNSATRRVVEALIPAKYQEALDLCLALNTEPRRDNALRHLLRSLLEQPIKDIPFDFLPSILDRFADPDERDAALTDIVGQVDRMASDQSSRNVVPVLKSVLGQVLNIQMAGRRTGAACHALSILKKSSQNKDAGLESAIERGLSDAWRAMDDDWRKVEAAFDVAGTLAGYCKDLAISYVEKAEKLREAVALENPDLNYDLALRLAVRAYAGLLASKVEIEQDLADLTERIEKLPSHTSRILLWTDVALRSFSAMRIPEGRRVIDAKVRPELTQLERLDKGEWFKYWCIASPALHCVHAKTTLESIRGLPLHWQDEACIEILHFVCEKVPAVDPFERSGEIAWQLSYDEISDLIDLAEIVHSDSVIYEFVSVIIETVKRQRSRFSSQQKASIVQRLTALVGAKLPAKRFIKHDGWLLVSKAQLLRLGRDTASEWANIIAGARNIPNDADRAIALGMIAELFWSLEPIQAARIFRDAKEAADATPSISHRVERYEDLASQSARVDPEFSKLCLSHAASLLSGDQSRDTTGIRQRIIDQANSFGSEFSSHLAAQLDTDQARKGQKGTARKRLESIEFRKKMLDEAVRPNELFSLNTTELPSAAWRNLGALNAGRIEAVHLSHAREYIEVAAQLPLSEAFPIFSWSIENATRRLSGIRDQAQIVLRGLFRATLQGCDLSAWVNAKASARLRRTSARALAERQLIGAGERERATDRIRQWLGAQGCEYLKISDQFVGPDELVEILRLVLSAAPKLVVRVVTSRKHQIAEKVSLPWDDAYRLRWRQLMDQDPPETQVVVAGLPNGDSPLHDRWWITKGAGLRLGTSFNSIGSAKDSELTTIAPELIPDFEAAIDACLTLSKRGDRGERVTYTTFNLWS
jgi:hypothetical protein